MNISTFTHQELHRPGSSSGNCSVAERLSADFIVNGESLLRQLVEKNGGHADFMGCFVMSHPVQNSKMLAELLVLNLLSSEPAPILIYICPECGDIACGAYSVHIEKKSGYYEWSKFAYVNGYETAHLIEEIGPFYFEERAYEIAIKSAAAL
jgi:hypothetical protein